MASNEILIQKAGLYTSVQDQGRAGYMAKGVARSGSMDYYCACLANWLVSNPSDAALLETAFQGLSIRFKRSCFIAITGADLGAELNNKVIERYQTVQVIAGDQLVFKKRKSGLYAYVAIAGNLNCQKIMGSTSMHAMMDLGTSSIMDGSVLQFTPMQQVPPQRMVPVKSIPVYSRHFTARIIKGPEHTQFPDEFIEQLTRESLIISSDSNRMGYRLKGHLTNQHIPKGIVTSGTVPGTIQITASGQPIVLMNDGPTTGGYPRIANIISSDLHHVAQLGPGDTLRFKWVSFEEADYLLEKKSDLLSGFISYGF